MAKLERYAYSGVPWIDYDDESIGERLPQLWQEQEEALAKLKQKGLGGDPTDIDGFVLSFPRGDGRAYYIVTKTKPLTVAWIAFGDNWSVEDALIRGLRTADIVKMKAAGQTFAQLFGG